MSISLENSSHRRGLRPSTSRVLPHVQLDQFSPPAIGHLLAARGLELPGVREKQSQIADPEVRALWIPDEIATTRPRVFIIDHEFCHLHRGGSMHLSLPLDQAKRTLELGWAEWHPLTGQGLLPKGLILVYAPRDETELSVIMTLLRASYLFAITKE